MPEYKVSITRTSCWKVTCSRRERQIKLDFGQFQTDYRINSPNYPPTAISSMIFESDVPASWTFHSADTNVVGLDMVIDHLKELRLLEKLTIRMRAGFPKTRIAGLIRYCSQLTELELSGRDYKDKDLENFFSGLVTRDDHSWLLKATRAELMKIKDSVGFHTQESTSIGNPKVA